jgi:16S rRNA (guanine527-N7)-methyltransferase
VPTAAIARLEDLCDRYALPSGAASALDSILALVDRDPTAPTTVTEPLRGADVHIADSLVALEVPEVRGARDIADLGAGAGVPGLVLALALPAAHVSLVESVGKKCDFISRAAAAANIQNAHAVHARAEEWDEGLGRHDLVTARALAPLTALVEYAAPLLRDRGLLCAWKGQRDATEEADGLAAAAATGMELRDICPVEPWAEVEARHLYLYVKVAPTPSRYPRRAGMARKRPIRASTAG